MALCQAAERCSSGVSSSGVRRTVISPSTRCANSSPRISAVSRPAARSGTIEYEVTASTPRARSRVTHRSSNVRRVLGSRTIPTTSTLRSPGGTPVALFQRSTRAGASPETAGAIDAQKAAAARAAARRNARRDIAPESTMRPPGPADAGLAPTEACLPAEAYRAPERRCKLRPMRTTAASQPPPTPGRLARPLTAADTGWRRWLPGLRTLREYEAAWLPNDLAAGLVLTTMLIPVGIAYAVASGVPGIYGLYATIVPLLAYAMFGPSRILVLGPDSSLAAVILAVVLPHSGGDATRAVALAGMMAVVSGLVCVLAGLLKLGFVTELLSKPIRYGYMNGIALTVLISQLPKLLGFSIDSTGPLRNLVRIGEGVLGGQANWTSFAVGVSKLAAIILF